MTRHRHRWARLLGASSGALPLSLLAFIIALVYILKMKRITVRKRTASIPQDPVPAVGIQVRAVDDEKDRA